MVAAALLLAACGGGGEATEPAAAPSASTAAPSRTAAAPTAAPSPTPSRPAATALRRYRAAREVAPVAAPTAVRIPSIGVASGLEALGRTRDGGVAVPGDWQRAGWFAEGPRPGQRGPAVILGHVDSRAGPAVFFRLAEVAVGDEVLVDREDGSVARFVVERVERHAKSAFPSDAVYFPTLQPSLRLITCGGDFDARAGHYRDNVVVFATAAAA